MAFVGGGVVVAVTIPVLFMDAEGVAFFGNAGVLELAALGPLLLGPLRDLGEPWRRFVLRFLPALLLLVATTVVGLRLFMALELDWRRKKLHILVLMGGCSFVTVLVPLTNTFGCREMLDISISS